MSLAQLLNPAPRGNARDDDGARSIDIGSQDSESTCSEEEYTDEDDGDSGHGYYSEERDDDDGPAESYIDDGPAQSFIDDGPTHSATDDGERFTEGEEAAREHRSAPPQLSGTLVDRWREREAPPGAPPQPWTPRADAFVAAGTQHRAPGPSSRREAVERWIAEREAAAGGREPSEAGYRSAPEQVRGIQEGERAVGRDKGRGRGRARPWGSVRAESFGKDSVEPEPAYHRPPPPPWFAGREPTPDVPEPRVPVPVLPETRKALVWAAPRIKVRSASPEAGSSAVLGVGGTALPEADGGVSDSGASSGSSPLIKVARARTAGINVSAAKRDGQRFPCDVCDKTFNRPTDALRHMNTVHEEEGGEWSKLSTCDVCGKKLARPDSLKRHRDVKHPSAGPPPKRRRGESGSVSAGSMV